ncbi:NAD(P)/FAD-dependent oxidoreductase [Massilibacterium senegalense]|uniref:NAD(P)/FAD-dependent oxidoreductase n=1 Tax=Massilibacterium senegalense TaxID=1632858 RepID=UPI0007818D21|nr:NAD(P)/FAD-dependent oxidoreductase [Massilibacterium senegalense]
MEQVIIIGGGISGLTCAMYTAKAGLKTLVFDGNQSQITKVKELQNYPGFEKISGTELITQIKEQIKPFGAILSEEQVINVEKNRDIFTIKTNEGEYQAKYVVLASNMDKSILESFDISSDTNPFIPSGKIKSAIGIGYEGETKIENLYLAGLQTMIESQAVVVAGQGAHVGIKIASKELGKSYMWHDL